MKLFNSSHLAEMFSEPLANLSGDHNLQKFLELALKESVCLLLTGPAGVGKSHLASWVCRELLSRKSDLRVGVKTESICELANLKAYDLIVFDDLDLFVKESRNGEALASLIAECKKQEISLILICDEHPESIGACSRTLVSALTSCFAVDIEYPNSQEKMSMARAMANHLELTNPFDNKMLANIKSPRELEGFLTRTKIINDLNQSGSSV